MVFLFSLFFIYSFIESSLEHGIYSYLQFDYMSIFSLISVDVEEELEVLGWGFGYFNS